MSGWPGSLSQIAIRGQIGWKFTGTKNDLRTQFGLTITQIRYN